MSKRWRELAMGIVAEHTRILHIDLGDADDEWPVIDMMSMSEAIEKAIETAVKEERERMPSEKEWVDWAHSWPSPHQAEVIFRTRTWLSTHAKVGVRE